MEMNRMVRLLSVLLVSVILTVVAPFAVMAATTADVTVTATPTYIAITNTPNIYDFAAVAPSSVTNTAGTTSCFTANNTGNAVSNITIVAVLTAGNWTGGVGWIHSNTAIAGVDTVGLKCGTDSGTITDLTVNTTSQLLYGNLAVANHTHWGMQLLAPTSFGDGVQKTMIVRLTIVQA
jgi:uncharacterized cupredoxin-like copper-binding protein